jgi:hypothetical protein
MTRHTARRRRSLSLVAGLVVALLPIVPATADQRGAGTLTGLGDEVVRWSGEFTIRWHCNSPCRPAGGGGRPAV